MSLECNERDHFNYCRRRQFWNQTPHYAIFVHGS
jgi:hypothetical protein